MGSNIASLLNKKKMTFAHCKMTRVSQRLTLLATLQKVRTLHILHIAVHTVLFIVHYTNRMSGSPLSTILL